MTIIHLTTRLVNATVRIFGTSFLSCQEYCVSISFIFSRIDNYQFRPKSTDNLCLRTKHFDGILIAC